MNQTIINEEIYMILNNMYKIDETFLSIIDNIIQTNTYQSITFLIVFLSFIILFYYIRQNQIRIKKLEINIKNFEEKNNED